MLKTEEQALLNAESHKPLEQMAYLKPDQVCLRYPFSRALVYELLNSGDFQSVLVHKSGSTRGIRLISVASIERYLAKLAQEQHNKKFTPVVPAKLISGRPGKRHKEQAPTPTPTPATTPTPRRGRRRPRKVAA
jgi:hypothetical protein